ncbi:hypothetical protein KIL84_001377 [Mauremys mutica]|uniref:Uncharacterized protein n=1 Tax=Mauremys mutica TaxID=74926 RepID=A0A9D3WYG5_9SAUR|nr:hypothetical protein KIL84_001377 [Mauremys mutica]
MVARPSGRSGKPQTHPAACSSETLTRAGVMSSRQSCRPVSSPRGNSLQIAHQGQSAKILAEVYGPTKLQLKSMEKLIHYNGKPMSPCPCNTTTCPDALL